jgi:hypothetical protein
MYASIIYFFNYTLYYCMYFKLNLSFYMFTINKTIVKVVIKNQRRQVFITERIFIYFSL